MIIVKQETIFGIDVYTFTTSKEIPYQLTFEENLSGKYFDVALVNLLGQSDSLYCKHLRSTISTIIHDYLKKHNCTLFFDIQVRADKSYLLLLKFLRWLKIEPRVNVKIEITTIDDTQYVEVYLTLNEDYLKSLETDYVDV